MHDSDIPIRDQQYFVAVTLAHDTDDKYDIVSVYADGSYCVGNTYWNGTACVVLSGDIKSRINNIPINAGESLIYYFDVPEFAGVYHVDVNSPVNLTMYARFAGVPTVQPPVYDLVSHNNKLVSESPAAGRWFLIVHLPEVLPLAQSVFSIGANFTQCTAETLSPGCNQTISTISTTQLNNNTLNAGEPAYYLVNATAGQSISVSVVGINGPVPSVYVSQGQLPSSDNYLIAGCHPNPPDLSSCKFSTTLNITASATATYYVMLSSNVTTSFAMWFNSTCAPNCAGTCTTNNPDLYGFCSCNENYFGLDCSYYVNPFPTQYIVLIIIAALVVASAVIGFLAWLYMRKRRAGYEKVV